MTAGSSAPVNLDIVIRRETDKAWGIADPNKTGNIIWLPKSQCEMTNVTRPKWSATLTCPKWLAERNRLL